MAGYSPQLGVLDFNTALYGEDAPVGSAGAATAATPLAPSRGATTPAANPHDRSDKGPKDWREDPVVWLTAAAAVGSGIIGFRFHWGPGAKASASVDVADELATIVGQILLTIAGIAMFKLFVAWTKVKSLQEFAAFI